MGQAMQLQHASSLPREFDAFLFARIDEGVGDTPLSVVSALARLDVDPWLEAAELTKLAREAAVRRLAALLIKLPGDAFADTDQRTVASGLIELLPAPSGAAVTRSSPGGEPDMPAKVLVADATMIFMVVTMIISLVLGLADGATPSPASKAGATAHAQILPQVPAAKAQP